MKKKRFVYYQPNAKDLKDQYKDCTVRALAKALGITWVEAFDVMTPFCREEQVSNIFDCPIDIRKKIMQNLGFDYVGVSVRGGKKRPTVYDFAKDHEDGTYICNVAHHVVCVMDGMYFDTWDSGNRPMYGYFVKK